MDEHDCEHRHGYGYELAREHAPKVQDELPWDDLPDPWDGDHNIEYWIWDGSRLVPASYEERLRIQEDERVQAARRHLKALQEHERREAHSIRRRFSTSLTWCQDRLDAALRQVGSIRHHGPARESIDANVWRPRSAGRATTDRGRARAPFGRVH